MASTRLTKTENNKKRPLLVSKKSSKKGQESPDTDVSPVADDEEEERAQELMHSNSTASTKSLSDSQDRASDRVIKRRRHFFLPKPTVEIPTYRIVNEDSGEEEEEEKKEKRTASPLTEAKATKKRKRESIDKQVEAPQHQKPEASSQDEDEEEDEEEEEQSENISLYSDEISGADFAPAIDVDAGEDKRPSKLFKRNADASVADHPAASKKAKEPAPTVFSNTEPRVHRRPGSHATSKYTEMSDHWEQYARFQQTMVPNLIRTARIVTNAMGQLEHSGDDDAMEEDTSDIRMSKQAIPVFEKYLSTRFSQIMDAAAQTYVHRGMERMTPDDVRLAIHLNPVFAQFDVERFLNGNRNLAPAFITLVDQLKVGKTHAKTQRCVYQHSDQRNSDPRGKQ